MIPIPKGNTIEQHLAWAAKPGIDYSLNDERATKWGQANCGWINHYEDMAITRAWEAANWKDHQWRQKECEYIRLIDGLNFEISELKKEALTEGYPDGFEGCPVCGGQG